MWKVIKSRLDDIHQLAISHNDVTGANIHVSESGKLILDYRNPSSEEHRKKDIKSLKPSFGEYSRKNSQNDQSKQVSEKLINGKSVLTK